MLWCSLVVVCLCLSVYKGDLENLKKTKNKKTDER